MSNQNNNNTQESNIQGSNPFQQLDPKTVSNIMDNYDKDMAQDLLLDLM